MLCDVLRSLADMMDKLGLMHGTFFRRNQLELLVRDDVLRMTDPDQPNHPDQAYVLAKVREKLAARHVNGEAGRDTRIKNATK